MALEIEARLVARWLALLVVAAGMIYFVRHLPSVSTRKAEQPLAATPITPVTVRIGDVDQSALLNQIAGPEGLDERALAEIEKRGVPKLTAAAEFVAARYEHEHNHDEQALGHVERALEKDPANASLHAWCATLLLSSGKTKEALMQSEQAGELEPESSGVQRIRGYVFYQAGQLPEAIAAWEHSLRLAPDSGVSQYLEKAKREAAVEEHFTETARGHFVLRYEGGHPGEALSEDLWRILERDYDELSTELGFTPKAAITVVLYNRQQFSDVTLAPEWAGAINDGKLRIPVGEVRGMTPHLEAVLRHELTHSFLQGAVPNCPVWLNEGLAQIEERKTIDALPATARSGGFVPLAQLEGTFQKMTPEEAQRAYVESLAAVEYLRASQGMEGVRILLRRLSEGEQFESALHSLTSLRYDELDRKTETFMTRRDRETR